MRNVLAAVISLGLTGCAAEFGAGFHLPEGSAERGREAFVALRCDSCHTVEGIDPPLTIADSGRFVLGGDTTRIKTYGDLVTSIVNPSHRVARGFAPAQGSGVGSPMDQAYLNDVMTVRQLIDLVALLQSAYRVVPSPFQPNWEIYPLSEEPDEPNGSVLPR